MAHGKGRWGGQTGAVDEVGGGGGRDHEGPTRLGNPPQGVHCERRGKGGRLGGRKCGLVNPLPSDGFQGCPLFEPEFLWWVKKMAEQEGGPPFGLCSGRAGLAHHSAPDHYRTLAHGEGGGVFVRAGSSLGAKNWEGTKWSWERYKEGNTQIRLS